MYDDRRLENDNMIFHRSRNFISFRYVRANCLLKWNVVVDCHGNGHKNNASHIYLLLSEGCYQAIENTGIMKDIVFEACSVLFGSFIHPRITFR